jgi:uncharacterized protein (DUF2252 family)
LAEIGGNSTRCEGIRHLSVSTVTEHDDKPVPSADERAARGRAVRKLVPRGVHGEWAPAADRPDPVDLLERQAATRDPALNPIRYGRMLVSPFAFFRGAALLMASDLGAAPRTGLHAQLGGDAHLSNFGVFGTPERRLAFDLNDFDETHPGPWEWDVKRLVASLVVAGRERSLSPKQRRAAVLATVASYREAMRRFARQSNLEVWYAHLDVDATGAARSRPEDDDVARARTRENLRELMKLTKVTGGHRRIVADPPLVVPADDLAQGEERERLERWLRALLHDYRQTLTTDRRRLVAQYRLTDFARKVVGVGSVGLRTWIAVLDGRDHDDALLLQVKEVQESVLAPFTAPSGWDNHGQRVVAGQRLMQAASDAFLGWERVEEDVDGRRRDYYVRQLHDWKDSADVDHMGARELRRHGRRCGWTLARAHARSGDRIAIAAYLGSSSAFDEAVAAFAERYADQNERDHAALREAVAAARVEATTGL